VQKRHENRLGESKSRKSYLMPQQPSFDVPAPILCRSVSSGRHPIDCICRVVSAIVSSPSGLVLWLCGLFIYCYREHCNLTSLPLSVICLSCESIKISQTPRVHSVDPRAQTPSSPGKSLRPPFRSGVHRPVPICAVLGRREFMLGLV
jgi:hypothetical protein